MLITVRVPDNQAAFFKKIVTQLSYEVERSRKEEKAVEEPIIRPEDMDEQDLREYKEALKEKEDYLAGRGKNYTMEEFWALLGKKDEV